MGAVSERLSRGEEEAATGSLARHRDDGAREEVPERAESLDREPKGGQRGHPLPIATNGHIVFFQTILQERLCTVSFKDQLSKHVKTFS